MIIDESGYLPITRTGAMLFFQFLGRRYEHASTILTSNKTFEDWDEIFGDDVTAAALVDRLVPHCHHREHSRISFCHRQHAELQSRIQATPTPERRSKAQETTATASG